MIQFTIGFIIAFLLLFIIGLTKARKISNKTWSLLWTILSLIYLAVIIFALLNPETHRFALGMSSAYILGVTIHLFGHLKER